MALSTPSSREQYGSIEQFGNIWNSLIKALQKSEDTEDFLEFKYCSSLRAQICRALIHMLNLATPEDLPCIYNTLMKEGDIIKNNMLQYVKSGVDGEETPGEYEHRDQMLKNAIDHVCSIQETTVGIKKITEITFFEDLLLSCEKEINA